jgi:outer membrane protein assembly factor BamB
MSGQEEVVPTSEGQYLRPAVVDQHGQYSSSPYAPWEVVDAEGAVIASLPGRAPEPLATDGSRPGVVLSHAQGGLAAIRVSDGETLWDETLAGPPGVLVRTRDLVLVVDGERQLTALDLSSGERRWTAALDGVDEELWGDASYFVRAAFTDGRVAVVGTPGLSQAGGARYTAFDLRSGDVVWTLDARSMGDGYAFAVDGRMLTWNYQTLTALG